MAQFIVNTSEEERNKVLQALVELNGATTPVSAIARIANLKQSRVRYAIQDLIDAGRIEKVPTKAFNKHYVRYCYKVL